MNPEAGPLRATEPAAEMLRTLAHDLRQPLSSIETIAYYLTRVLPSTDEKVREQLDQIRQLVEQANRILNHGAVLPSDAEIVAAVKHPPQLERDAARILQQPLGINAA